MPHPVVHFEIGCQDREKTTAFYETVFGWTIDPRPTGAIDTGASSGITGHIVTLGHDPERFTHFYIQTEDIAESLKAIESAGGKTLIPGDDIPTGTFAWFNDIAGNTVGLWKPKP